MAGTPGDLFFAPNLPRAVLWAGILLIGSIPAGCSSAKKTPRGAPQVTLTKPERKVLEILLLHVQPLPSKMDKPFEYRVICLGVDGKDPREAFLAQVRKRYGGSRFVRKMSDCGLDLDKCVHAIHMGFKGQKLAFSRVQWLPGGRARVGMQHYICPHIRGKESYLLRKANQTWVVDERIRGD